MFRQSFDQKSGTFTYLLADAVSREAVLVDTVFEQHQRDAALVTELGLRLVATLETHVHADHVTGAWLMRERFGCSLILSKASGVDCADRLAEDGDRIAFGDRCLEVRATPGHTAGCVTYVLGDRSAAFTGDALLVRGAGRTDFQQGDARKLYRSVHSRIFSLPDATLIYPAHDYAGRTCTSVAEEKAHNPRLGGLRSEEDFVGFMENLGLGHPKQMDIAIPANMKCGRPASPEVPAAPEWAPVVRTYAGIPEVSPEWVAEHRSEVTLVDVRQPAEYHGELGHIEGARLVPLGQLESLLEHVPSDVPVITVCRSGGRSAQAALLLERRGYAKVANLAGGMIRWREARVP